MLMDQSASTTFIAMQPANANPIRTCSGSLRAVAFLACASVLAGCSATESSHPLRGPASALGFATTVGEPKDFVKARRQSGELAYVPIGREGTARSVALRDQSGARDLAAELDQQRATSEGFARRATPVGAYGRALPSVAAPARPGLPERPTAGAPDSFPVNPNRLRQMRDNARGATQ